VLVLVTSIVLLRPRLRDEIEGGGSDG